jgi:hypothetical protein
MQLYILISKYSKKETRKRKHKTKKETKKTPKKYNLFEVGALQYLIQHA